MFTCWSARFLSHSLPPEACACLHEGLLMATQFFLIQNFCILPLVWLMI